MGATPDPRREAVLADVRAGMLQREVAERYGVPLGTVGRWCAPPKKGVKKTKTPRGDDGKVTGEGGGGAFRGGTSAARARAPEPPPVVEAIGPELRRTLRGGVVRASRFIAGEIDATGAEVATGAVASTDWQQVAHAARALDILLARVPDVMTFDEVTNATRDADKTDDAVSAKVRDMLNRRHAAPPSEGLRLVKSETG